MEHDPPSDHSPLSFPVGLGRGVVHPLHDPRVHRVLLHPSHREPHLRQVLHRAEASRTLRNGRRAGVLRHLPPRQQHVRSPRGFIGGGGVAVAFRLQHGGHRPVALRRVHDAVLRLLHHRLQGPRVRVRADCEPRARVWCLLKKQVIRWTALASRVSSPSAVPPDPANTPC